MIPMHTLEDTHAALARLSGINNDLLKAHGFDSVLEEQAEAIAALHAVSTYAHELGEALEAFHLLHGMLTDLDNTGNETLPVSGLRVLLGSVIEKVDCVNSNLRTLY